MTDAPDIRYCMTDDGVRLAYYVIGEGPPVVRASGFPSHIAAGVGRFGGSDLPLRLVAEHTVIAYDARGMGSSQRVLDFTLDTRVADLRAVVQHVKLGHFALEGLGHASVVAAAYAARYPDEVTQLVLISPYADGPQLYAVSPAFSAYAALEAVTVEQWDFMTMTIASRATGYTNTEAARAGAEFMKASITAEGYVAYRRDNRLISIVNELSAITAPTLVIGQALGDAVPPELSQDVAARIANARYFAAPSGTAAAFGVQSAAIDDAVLAFLRPAGTALPASAPPTSSPSATPGAFRTVLFTDLVGHTEMMQRLGDAKGRDVLREHERITRETLKQHGGAEVKTMGDGFLASFGSVTAAMDCAIALQRAFAAHTDSMSEPLRVRVGLNAGEPIEEDGDLFGSTVIMASRIAAAAGAGEILVPEPLRHLLSGKSYVYADRGDTLLKGFEDAVRLYEVRWRE